MCHILVLYAKNVEGSSCRLSGGAAKSSWQLALPALGSRSGRSEGQDTVVAPCSAVLLQAGLQLLNHGLRSMQKLGSCSGHPQEDGVPPPSPRSHQLLGGHKRASMLIPIEFTILTC